MTTAEKAHLKNIVKEILREDKSLLREIMMEILEEEKELQKTQYIAMSEQEQNQENFDKLLEETSKQYKKVWEALA